MKPQKSSTKTIDSQIEVTCSYDLMNEVMRLVKTHNLNIDKQYLKINCKFIISIRQKDFENIKSQFESVYGLEVKDLSK